MVFIWMALAYMKEVGPHQGYVDVFCGVSAPWSARAKPQAWRSM
jgi:hypothetical protein